MLQKITSFLKNNYDELIFQTIVTVLLFLVYSYNQENANYYTQSNITAIPYKIPFFLNYAIGAWLISYVLLPKLYVKKDILFFTIGLIIIEGVVIIVDEFILEKIYFPTTRGTYFPGVIPTLIETQPVIITIILFKFVWNFHKKQREVKQLKNLVKDSELQFLKSQINPHFLFNNLNNLYSHAIENSPKTPSIIIELSSVLRYMLYDCKENYVSLEKEISHLKNFTELYKLQIEHRGNIQFKTDTFENSKLKIAPLILMVFIENAFKHSTSNQSDNIHITINVKTSEQGVLKFSCKNNYIVSNKKSNLESGIGLENVKKRLMLLYPKKHDLNIEMTNNIYKVELSINLKQDR
ncbi:sensor histidine kinase [Formosa sp. A9]|uniref:sensor histidine kinase n=1 Tax=Formosa sp. A9 TaxID=3442641 RepID=UPI003EB988F5